MSCVRGELGVSGLGNPRHSRLGGLRYVVVALLAFICPAFASGAEPGTPPKSQMTTPAEFEAYARRNFWQAMARYNRKGHEPKDAWNFARTCFDAAEYATNNAERVAIAEQGITACREVLAADPNSAAAHYYLGMNLGEVAQTKSLGALSIVSQMEREFDAARQLDPKFDNAGPDRCLGLLYRDAPSFASIGNKTKARRHLQAATDLAPDYPENRLNQIETYLKWSDRVSAKREMKALEEVLPKARAKLTGDEWAASWADWDKRISQAKKKIDNGSNAIESPHSRAAAPI
jgi:tetratricopeptide (TPR) repeat protein